MGQVLTEVFSFFANVIAYTIESLSHLGLELDVILNGNHPLRYAWRLSGLGSWYII